MAEIAFDDVWKAYTPGEHAVRRLDLEIADGEFMVLVGPSGCGKTTALRMVAGLEEITEGTISIGGRVVNEMPPKDRDIAMVFQNYALYPHMSVFENMAFGLKLQKVPRDDIESRVGEAAGILGLEDLLDRKPKALSGGQRQRVAMGRAIVRHPQAFLMDEPLSNLDAKLRVQMRAEIARIQRALGVTTMYVTHDQTEAMTMGDRVAVIRNGELQQVDDPQRLYDEPVNVFVAGFIGSPAMNLLDAEVGEAGDGLEVRFGGFRLAIPDRVIAERPALRGHAGRRVVLGIRPENFEDAALATDTPADRRVVVTPELREALGSDVIVHFPVDSKPVVTDDTKDLLTDAGGEAEVQRLAQAGTTYAMARLDPRTKAVTGQPIELAVDTSRLHFFDPTSNQAIRES